jgi:hypothetical protein
MISVLQYSVSAGNGVIVLSDTLKESEWIWDRIFPNSLEKRHRMW